MTKNPNEEDYIMKNPFKKKVEKSYSSVLSQFRQSVDDMNEIIQREAQAKDALEAAKSKIDDQIAVAEQEIGDCEVAIQNIHSMFPGLARSAE